MFYRGKVILADVEKEVILELASTAGKTPTSLVLTKGPKKKQTASSTSSIKSPLASTSQNLNPQISITSSSQMIHSQISPALSQNESLLISSVATASHNIIAPPTLFSSSQNMKSQTIPSFNPNVEMPKINVESLFVTHHLQDEQNKDKDTTLASVMYKSIQPKPTSSTDSLEKKTLCLTALLSEQPALSPTAYQENLYKESIAVHGHSPNQKKTLIHPKFLISDKPVHENQEIMSSPLSLNSKSPHKIEMSSSCEVDVSSVPPLLMTKQKHVMENGSDTFEKKYSSSKQKENLQTSKQECKDADKEKTESIVKIEEKSRSKCSRHKEECPNCQSKLNLLKEKNQDKSFHIEAYKAYKNKNRENCSTKGKETKTTQIKDKSVENINKLSSGDIRSQNSMECLKPCADAITFYETSTNSRMTASYPVVSGDKKSKRRSKELKSVKKFNLSKDIPPPFPIGGSVRWEDKDHMKNGVITSIKANPSSTLFYDSNYCKLRISSSLTSCPPSTNNLSHPSKRPLSLMTRTTLSNVNPHYFNVPVFESHRNSYPNSKQNQKDKSEYLTMVSCANIFKMPKEQIFEYNKRNSSFKDLKYNPLTESVRKFKEQNKTLDSKQDCKPISSGDSEKSSVLYRGQNHTNTQINSQEDDFQLHLREEKDYFDYKYRLCYVDTGNAESPSQLQSGSEFENKTMLNDEKLAGCKSLGKDLCFSDAKSYIAKTKKSDKGTKNDKSSKATSSVQGKFDINSPIAPHSVSLNSSQVKYSVEDNNSITSFSNSFSDTTLGSSVFSQSKLENGCKESSCHLLDKQNGHDKCFFHFKPSSQSENSTNGFRIKNVTSETFSVPLSKPIFSVLPFEEYSVDAKSSSKNMNQHLDKKDEPYNACIRKNPGRRSSDITCRILKDRVRSSDHSRNSSSSIQSANEIHILKLNDLNDLQGVALTSTVSENQNPLPTTSHPTSKQETDTLQVRYIPKSHSSSKNKKIQTTAHAQLSSSASPTASLLSVPQYHNHSGFSAQAGYHQSDLPSPALSSPDLLQVSIIQPGASPKTELPTTSQSVTPKKPSFLSRLANSPLSFFQKDSKNNGSK